MGQRADNLAQARKLLAIAPADDETGDVETHQDVATSTFICRSCSAPMIIIDVLAPDHAPRAPPLLRAVS